MKRIFLTIICLGFALGALAEEKKAAPLKSCEENFAKDGSCPAELCQVVCDANRLDEGCIQTCKRKDCPQISVENCPADQCQVLTGCEGKPICFFKLNEGSACGDIAYSEQDVSCCEGLKRRCGVEFFDGSCDMAGRNSMYSVPICIPCGDGVCGQFENRCNCPEDCNKGAPYTGFEFEKKEPPVTPANPAPAP